MKTEIEMVNNLGETTEVVEQVAETSKVSFGKKAIVAAGTTFVIVGGAKLIKVLYKRCKAKKQAKAEAQAKSKEELIQSLRDEGYTVVEPLDDINTDGESVVKSNED